jgi:putative endonuclease
MLPSSSGQSGRAGSGFAGDTPMYFVYVLKSINSERLYIGSTDNIARRLQEHNAGKVKSSKPFNPYKLIHEELYATRSEARKREIQIKKSGIIRKKLKEEPDAPIV